MYFLLYLFIVYLLLSSKKKDEKNLEHRAYEKLVRIHNPVRRRIKQGETKQILKFNVLAGLFLSSSKHISSTFLYDYV